MVGFRAAPLLPEAKAQKLVFAYDYLGRRVQKTVFGGYNKTADTFGSTPVTQTKYVYNGWHLIATLDATDSNALVASYTWGLDLSGIIGGAGGVGGLLLVQEGGTTYLPAYDAMGNVHAMIKASDGTIAAAYEYDAFGRTLRESGPYAADNPFRFSTKYTDIETGLVYHETRFYSADLGRFLNRDSIGEQGGLNLYAYVSNRVPNAWDYLGMNEGSYWFTTGPNGETIELWPHITGGGDLNTGYRDALLLAGSNIASDPYAAMDAQLIEVIINELASQSQILGYTAAGDMVVGTYTAEAYDALQSINTVYQSASGRPAVTIQSNDAANGSIQGSYSPQMVGEGRVILAPLQFLDDSGSSSVDSMQYAPRSTGPSAAELNAAEAAGRRYYSERSARLTEQSYASTRAIAAGFAQYRNSFYTARVLSYGIAGLAGAGIAAPVAIGAAPAVLTTGQIGVAAAQRVYTTAMVAAGTEPAQRIMIRARDFVANFFDDAPAPFGSYGAAYGWVSAQSPDAAEGYVKLYNHISNE